MTGARSSIAKGDKQKELVLKKENNPFSEQEKHGEEAQRRAPGGGQEYQGDDPSVQRRAPGVEDDSEGDRQSA
jgi:hypothetical protein